MRLVEVKSEKVKNGQAVKEPESDLSDSIQRLMVHIRDAAKVVRKYGGRGFVVRMLLSDVDSRNFRTLHFEISGLLQTISFTLVLSPPPPYEAENKQLRVKLCEAAKLTAEERKRHDSTQIAMERLSQSADGKEKMKSILMEINKSPDNVDVWKMMIGNEMEGMSKEIAKLNSRMDNMEQRMDFLEATVFKLLAVASEKTIALGLGEFLSRW